MRTTLLAVLASGFALGAPALGDESSPTATLVVVPAGGWGRVSIDGEDQGLGPVTVQVAPGRHLVQLAESEYHAATERDVVLAPGERLELTLPRVWKQSWVEVYGWPEGTWLEVDGGPGPVVGDGVRLAIGDGLPHGLVFRQEGRVLRTVVVQRCVDPGCLLPGTVRVERWQPDGAPPD